MKDFDLDPYLGVEVQGTYYVFRISRLLLNPDLGLESALSPWDAVCILVVEYTDSVMDVVGDEIVDRGYKEGFEALFLDDREDGT
jgi:hypothetical protein